MDREFHEISDHHDEPCFVGRLWRVFPPESSTEGTSPADEHGWRLSDDRWMAPISDIGWRSRAGGSDVASVWIVRLPYRILVVNGSNVCK